MNSLGQRTKQTLGVDPLADGGGVTTTAVEWDYNARDELVEADHDTAANKRAYKYDGIGNRKETVSGTVTLTNTDDYASNAVNEYSKVEGANLPAAAHDDDGNLLDDGVLEYFWNAENRLVRVEDGDDVIAEYTYDYRGRRIAKSTTSDAPQGAGNRFFFYDGWNLIAEYADDPWTPTALHFSYTWGLDLSQSRRGAGGVGGLLVVEKHGSGATGIYYPTYDGNGNVSEYLDDTGTRVAHYQYDPFGNLTPESTGSHQTLFRHRFSTKYFDEETGFYYYGYRYFDPVTGRWPSRDSIGERGGLNLYGFVKNDGTSKIDIHGLQGYSSEELNEAAEIIENGNQRPGENQIDVIKRLREERSEELEVENLEDSGNGCSCGTFQIRQRKGLFSGPKIGSAKLWRGGEWTSAPEDPGRSMNIPQSGTRIFEVRVVGGNCEEVRVSIAHFPQDDDLERFGEPIPGNYGGHEFDSEELGNVKHNPEAFGGPNYNSTRDTRITHPTTYRSPWKWEKRKVNIVAQVTGWKNNSVCCRKTIKLITHSKPGKITK